ncbi:hypothetical protein DACRYDRAFT_59339 [Dacryopinax primogenitus]|uniref:Voltage-gated hydrogen channel 1 n=1 Tax=Dacryopinax primogenitus (strain DJM 731) TaxID=1858805 RepID=M5G108_DACPD|nr:uncharacterized protein DACRYDRAFT_59339 [Dacryopinax primogenitus]EJT97467.1 hypothetical protein DACRYDRAFT_59339 [Dacryopinax primogenitus]
MSSSRETQPLLSTVEAAPPADIEAAHPEDETLDEVAENEKFTWRMWTAEKLESKRMHWFILTLIIIDSSLVVADLAYTLLQTQCPPPEERPLPLELSEYASILISSIFVLEIPFSFWALGWEFYDPFYGVAHAPLHCVDAIVILGTFVLEVVLRGRDRELAGLFVLLRFWRIVKLVGGVAVGVGEIDEESAKRLAKARIRIRDQDRQIDRLIRENVDLKRRIAYAEQDLEGV